MENLLETYSGIKECQYKNEHYSVRDNGAVLRHPLDNRRTRPTDNKWTFGKVNPRTGYLEIASVRVHRIVATAFHGESPSKQHVVDHKDTNRQNNRPENLRWITKFENVLHNPITVKRIETICNCSIEEFLSNPEEYRHLLGNAPYDISWMRNVNKAEAKSCRENLTKWAESDKPILGNSLGDWIFRKHQIDSEERVESIFKKVRERSGISRKELCSNNAKRGNYYEARIYAAKLLRSELNLSDREIGKLLGVSEWTINLYIEVTADRYSQDYKEVHFKQSKLISERSLIIPDNVVQLNWGAESSFPLCPKGFVKNPIKEYSKKLESGTALFYNAYYEAIISKYSLIEDGNCLLVLFKFVNFDNEDKRWGIMKISYDNGIYIHELVLNYNGTQRHYWEIDAENHFHCIVSGKEWKPLYDSQGNEFKDDYQPL